jgi:hypothetical protein
VERTRQTRAIPFPLIVPAHPVGEAPPDPASVPAGQLRRFVSVPGYADGIYENRAINAVWAWYPITIVATAAPSFFVAFVQRNSPAEASAEYDWTAMPSALTELYGATSHRKEIDLTGCTQLRLTVQNSNAASGAVLRLQYSLDNGGSFTSVTATDVALITGGAAWVTSGWVALPVDAAAFALWRVAGRLGDGAAAARFFNILAQFK